MKILVMGGTQFVSSSVAKYLIEKGHEVDVFTRGINPINFDGFKTHLKGNRKSVEDLNSQLDGKYYDFVYDISAYTKDDVALLLSVLDRRNLKNYIFCSSGSVYEETDKITDEDFPRGYNKNWGDYGFNKKEAEDYLFELHEKENFPMTIFRPTYIYGEGNNLYRESYFFDRISDGLDIPIPDGNNRDQFIHIDDLVKTFESAMNSKKAVGNAYNLTHPEEITWKILCETVIEIIEKKIAIKKVNYKEKKIKSRNFFPFKDVTYLTSIEKLKKDGLYEPKINLKDGLTKTYKWYCEVKPKLKDNGMKEIENALK